MSIEPPARGVISYIFCADAGAVADWCVEVLGFVERERWPDEAGVARNVELMVGDSEVWLDGRFRTGKRRPAASDPGSACWLTMWERFMTAWLLLASNSIRPAHVIIA